MTPVEVLRKAAAEMRSRAEAATPGPWRHTANGWVMYEDGDVARALAADIDGERDPSEGDQDADHIASWHPAVALAVADWLEDEAEDISMTFGERVDLETLDLHRPAALAVARVYIGEQP